MVIIILNKNGNINGRFGDLIKLKTIYFALQSLILKRVHLMILTNKFILNFLRKIKTKLVWRINHIILYLINLSCKNWAFLKVRIVLFMRIKNLPILKHLFFIGFIENVKLSKVIHNVLVYTFITIKKNTQTINIEFFTVINTFINILTLLTVLNK